MDRDCNPSNNVAVNAYGKLYRKVCIVSYDGTELLGWQRQPEPLRKKTVQGNIENALSTIFKQDIYIHGSGRTDKGVHAIGQVFHFDAPAPIPNEAILKALNSLIPESIAIKSVEDSIPSFHARKSAVKKTYIYRIYNGAIRSPLEGKRSLHIKSRLNLYELRGLFKVYEGAHDFSSFCVQKERPENTERTIFSTEVNQDGDIFTISITGNGFLHNMVRIMVGVVLYSIRYDLGKDHIEHVLATKDRDNTVPTAKAEGLYLYKVYYK